MQDRAKHGMIIKGGDHFVETRGDLISALLVELLEYEYCSYFLLLLSSFVLKSMLSAD